MPHKVPQAPAIICAVDDEELWFALESACTNVRAIPIRVTDPVELINCVSTDAIAAVVLDKDSTDVNAVELAVLLRSASECSQLPIIFMTRQGQVDLRSLTNSIHGQMEFMLIPFDADLLEQRFAAHLETKMREQAKALSLIELQNYQAAMEVHLQEVERLNNILQNQGKELRDKTRLLEQRTVQLEEANKLKDVFLAHMSHEIRTPMNAIIGIGRLLDKTLLNEDQRRLLSLQSEAAHSLLSLINDLLDLSKIESGKLRLESVAIDSLTVVESSAELLAPQACEKGLIITSYVSPKMPSVLMGDPMRLKQILVNLASNAVKFSESGHIAIRATVNSEFEDGVVVRFSVSDSGVGIAPEDRGKLFEPFIQLKNAKTNPGGTGLGLSICKRLVELMGGEIGVESAPGAGSTFWFTVPMKFCTTSSRTTPVIGSLRGVRVLICDDDPLLRRILKVYLHAWKMTCDEAASGSEALEKLRAAAESGNPFNVAIIDRCMPEMTGPECATLIKADNLINDVKLILLTGYDKPGQWQEAIELGFHAYALKPIRQSTLFNCIAHVMGQFLFPREEKNRPDTVNWARGRDPRPVLLVEDNPINQKVAVAELEDLGLKVHLAATGREAIEMLSKCDYSLVLLDCQMPEMDGFEAIGIIREMEKLTRGQHIPVIAMTAHAMPEDRDRCLAAGMDDYLSKPFEPSDLIFVLGKWLPILNRYENQKNSNRITVTRMNLEALQPLHPRLPVMPKSDAIEPSSTSAKSILSSAIDNGTGHIDLVKASHTAPPVPVSSTKIDFNRLLERYKEPGAKQLLSMFIPNTRSQLRNMKKAIEEQDAGGLASLAHAHRGACTMMYAHDMASACRAVETAAKSSDWNDVNNNFRTLENTLTELEDALRLVKL